MSRDFQMDHRTGPRYLVNLPVRAEWDDDESGRHVVAEGETENVGPEGALVHLHELPNVGSRIQLYVTGEKGLELQAVAEVLRLERNPAQPLAALQLMNATEEWRGRIWEYAATYVEEYDSEYDDD